MKRRIFILFLFVLLTIGLASCESSIRWRSPGEDGRVSINSKKELESLIRNGSNGKGFFDTNDAVALPNMEKSDGMAPDSAGPEEGKDDRDYVDTNNQVEGVDEGDIVKTDGYNIYYAPSSGGKVFHLNVLKNGKVEVLNELLFKGINIENLYLTDDYLVVVGNRHRFFYDWYITDQDEIDTDFYDNDKVVGVVSVYTKDSLELVYSFKSENNISNVRLFDNTLFFTYYDYRHIPKYEETIDGVAVEKEISYKDVYFFKGVEGSSLTVYNLLDLSTFKLNVEGYIGYTNVIYVSGSSIYTTYVKFEYVTSETSKMTSYKIRTVIAKIDVSNKELSYKATGTVDGYVFDSYWMDEHDGYLRVMATDVNPIKNKLYILNEEGYNLKVAASLVDGIGKPREEIKSVRFMADRVFVVTFEQTDPLYTIDLSNVLKPVIISDIEEDGYNTYLHVWNDEGTKLIGLGYDATKDGRVTGMKMSAYDIEEDDPLYTYYFESYGTGTYLYAEAINNPKAMIVSPKHNVIAFNVHTNYYDEDGYRYETNYYIFKIDFENNKIIGDPIIINHGTNNHLRNIDRGVMIIVNNEAYIYTLSSSMVKTYSLTNDEVIGTLILEGLKNNLPGDDLISN